MTVICPTPYHPPATGLTTISTFYPVPWPHPNIYMMWPWTLQAEAINMKTWNPTTNCSTSTSRSNHPPALKKNIPLNINKRLSNISSSKEIFNEAIPPYQKVLEEIGYDFKLTFNSGQTTRKKKNRKGNTTWYNPQWDSNVKTNLGKKFLGIVDKCFAPTRPSTDTHSSSATRACRIWKPSSQPTTKRSFHKILQHWHLLNKNERATAERNLNARLKVNAFG